MDLQGDINWIKTEIDKVRDPQLINAFKSLLNYRNSKESSSEEILKEKMVARALRSEEDIKAGRVYTRSEAEEKMRSRLGL